MVHDVKHHFHPAYGSTISSNECQMHDIWKVEANIHHLSPEAVPGSYSFRFRRGLTHASP